MKRCRICGCTDTAACPERCSWVQGPPGFGDVCSACRQIAGELGTVLVMGLDRAGEINTGTDRKAIAEQVGWHALWFLVADVTGPRARLQRWPNPELNIHIPRRSRPTDPTPPPDHLVDFVARGQAAQAAVNQAIAAAAPPAKRKKRKARR